MSTQSLERTLPHNIDAEKSVLGSILVNNENYYRVIETLRPEDFYLDAHRVIYRKMVELIERSKAIDLITIQEELVRASQLESAGGITYLAGLLDGIPHLANIDHYIEIISEKALMRQLINSANKIMAECFDQAEPAEEILDRAEQALFGLSEKRLRTGFISVKDMELPATKLLEKLYTEREMITGVATGFQDLDRMTSGLQSSDLIILAARPSVGKTSLALNIAQHVALREGKSVGFFSLEMSMEQLGFRVLCSEADVDAKKVRDGFASKEAIGRLVLAQTTIAGANFFIDDSAAVTVPLMRAKAQRLQREKGLDLIFVDYLQLMAGHGRFDNRTQEGSQISRGLKLLAKELKVPIVALSQLSRQPEKRTGDQRKPQLADLRDSGSLEQDADVVVMLYREELYDRNTERRGIADVIIAKQRNGPTGDFELVFLPDHMTFRNYARQAPPPGSSSDQPF